MPRLELEEGASLPDWSLGLRRRGGQWAVTENKQYAPEKEPRKPSHLHDYGQNERPVLSFDLHGTLTPDWGYPLLSSAFEGVKAYMDRAVARGACIHVCSASLDNPDPDLNEARTAMVWSFIRKNGLPVGFVGPNTEATIRLDDRGVEVPLVNPDWAAIAGDAEKRMLSTYYIDPDGHYARRDDLKPVGDLIQEDEYPKDKDAPQDAPRGFSTPLIDIDFHRTLMPAWGTRRDAPPDPDGVAIISKLYAEGYSIQFSCGGWNPATNDEDWSRDRVAWQRLYLRRWGIPYDRLVAKDDNDLWHDDKVIQFTDWPSADEAVRARVGPPVPWHTTDGQRPQDAPIKSYRLRSVEESEQRLLSAIAESHAALLAKIPEPEAKKPEQPAVVVNATIQMPEGFGQVNVNEGAIQNHHSIAEGAVKVIHNPPGGEVTMVGPDGKTTTLTRR